MNRRFFLSKAMKTRRVFLRFARMILNHLYEDLLGISLLCSEGFISDFIETIESLFFLSTRRTAIGQGNGGSFPASSRWISFPPKT